MAADSLKRLTVFPGSHQQTDSYETLIKRPEAPEVQKPEAQNKKLKPPSKRFPVVPKEAITADFIDRALRPLEREQSPWDRYQKRYDLHLGETGTIESYLFDGSIYIVFEDADISLEEMIIARPSEVELVAILYQCLAHFEEKGICHGSISKASILLTRHGVVKINVEALGRVMSHFMGIDIIGGKPASRKIANWSPEAVDFLMMTMDQSATKLKSV
ncbi:hypothetical protein B0T11DRAFT_298810 [Plectosphaerella cucumerina]|uniref:Protein kinase domain-containing protein n=1 Tax=Plectosphaerella cucumerina TaxID=40658 RepID=A0A8K0X683_9PEZI|nr:hypothetical protein B0T11DRAFT_298810 [Plectosphaerella cucumerina]